MSKKEMNKFNFEALSIWDRMKVIKLRTKELKLKKKREKFQKKFS